MISQKCRCHCEYEVITELHGGQGGLLDRVQFGTNRGRLSTAYGGTGGENFTFKATSFLNGKHMKNI